MSGFGLIAVAATGSLTEPSKLKPAVASALTANTFCGHGLADAVLFPSLRAVALSNGVDFQYHFRDAAQYLTGPLAPYTAPASTSSTNRATLVWDFVGSNQPQNNDEWALSNGISFSITIRMKTTLTTTMDGGFVPSTLEVKISGVNLAGTIANIQAAINGTGTEGTEFHWRQPTISLTDARALLGITVSATSAHTATFRVSTFGTVGNTAVGIIYVNGGGTPWTLAGVDTVGSTNYFSGGTVGTGTTPAAGVYQHGYSFTRTGDDAQTAISLTTSITTDSEGALSISGFDTAPTRDGMSAKRLWRTLTDASEFFRVKDFTSDPVTDDQSDLAISTRPVVPPYDETIQRPYGSGYPIRYRYHAMHKGALVGAGARLHAVQTATATVTTLTRTVTIAAAYAAKVTTHWIGRAFKFDADADSYVINDVSESAGTLTLNRPYTAATVAMAAACTITDDRNPFEVIRCEPLLINDWPVAYTDEGVSSEDPTGVTGLRALASGDFAVFTTTGAWMMLGENDSGFQIVPRGEGYGAYCNQAIVDANGRLFWIGAGGVQTWRGVGDPERLSAPGVGQDGVARGIVGTLDRINEDAAAGIVSNYNPSLNLVRWWVPVDGSPFNNFVIMLDLQTGAFTFDSCDGVTAADTIVGPDGSYVTIVGDMYGNLWQMDLGTSCGAWGFECVQSVLTYTAASAAITVASTPFPTTSGGLVGVPVFAISAAGVIERRTIASNTSSALSLDGPFTTAPAVGTQIVVGGIYLHGKTAKFSMEAPDYPKTVSSIKAQFKKSTAGQMWFAASVDDADPTLHVNLSGVADAADLTAPSGTKWFDLRKGPGYVCQIEFFAIAPGFDLSLIGWTPTILVLDEVRA